MGTRERPVDRGTLRGRRLRVAVGADIRAARLDHGLTLAHVGAAVGVSGSTQSRLERGVLEHVDLVLLARTCAVVGLDLSVKTYPGGSPIRDAAQLELVGDFRHFLHASIGWAAEVPLPGFGDQRAWDGLVSGSGWRYGVEAETAPNDGQATLRRLALKQRDGQVDGVLLIVRDTRRTREFLREITAVAGSTFPIPGARAVELLRVGVDPGGSAIIMLPRARAVTR